MRTGQETLETSTDHHLHAVISGAVAVLCQEAHRTMIILDDLGDESPIPDLFNKAIKYQMISGVAPSLQHIVDAVVCSADGVPVIPEEHHAMLRRVMEDYPMALEASKQGAMSEYRAERMSVLAHRVDEQMCQAPMPGSLPAAVQACVREWDTRGPQTSFEAIIQNIIGRV